MATILIVEDRPENREFLAIVLRYRNHKVVEAGSAFEGLLAVRAVPPDLIITDVVMPEIDGYEFTRCLRIDPATTSIPIIFWTAEYHDRESARALAESCGVACILAKPSDPETLLAAVDRVLANPSGSPGALNLPEFQREHARLLSDKIHDQVLELEAVNERLRASENQYRALFESNPFPMWIVDSRSGMFLALNNAAVRHYGYSRREFAVMCAPELLVAKRAGPVPVVEPLAEAAVPEDLPVPLPRTERHRLKSGHVIEVFVFRHRTVFEGKGAWLELIQDVTAKNRAEREVRESRTQLHHLAERLRSAQEEERTRIARHLHDELGQQLTALKMTSDWILRRLPAAAEPELAVRQKLQSSRDLIDEMIATVQTLATELRPGILDYGIGAAVEWCTQQFQSRSTIACRVSVPDVEEPLEPARATEIYRIFQESLTNVARHSDATRLDVELKREETTLVLQVRDNGKGITQEQAASRDAIGLLGMRERAALIGAGLSIRGTPGVGTTVRLEVPLR